MLSFCLKSIHINFIHRIPGLQSHRNPGLQWRVPKYLLLVTRSPVPEIIFLGASLYSVGKIPYKVCTMHTRHIWRANYSSNSVQQMPLKWRYNPCKTGSCYVFKRMVLGMWPLNSRITMKTTPISDYLWLAERSTFVRAHLTRLQSDIRQMCGERKNTARTRMCGVA